MNYLITLLHRRTQLFSFCYTGGPNWCSTKTVTRASYAHRSRSRKRDVSTQSVESKQSFDRTSAGVLGTGQDLGLRQHNFIF